MHSHTAHAPAHYTYTRTCTRSHDWPCPQVTERDKWDPGDKTPSRWTPGTAPGIRNWGSWPTHESWSHNKSPGLCHLIQLSSDKRRHGITFFMWRKKTQISTTVNMLTLLNMLTNIGLLRYLTYRASHLRKITRSHTRYGGGETTGQINLPWHDLQNRRWYSPPTFEYHSRFKTSQQITCHMPIDPCELREMCIWHDLPSFEELESRTTQHWKY